MTITRSELAAALSDFEWRLKINGVVVTVALGAFLTALKLFE